jgi:hypothetical protein
MGWYTLQRIAIGANLLRYKRLFIVWSSTFKHSSISLRTLAPVGARSIGREKGGLHI